MQTRTNRTKLLKSDLNKLVSLKQEADSANEVCRLEREMARYDAVCIVESMPVTLKEKATLAGISERKYHYARRVARDYPDRNDFFEYLSNNPAATVCNFKSKRQPSITNIIRSIRNTLRTYEMDYTNPEVIHAITLLYNKIKVENIIDNNHLDRAGYLANQPCVICGEILCGDKSWIGDGLKYPICDTCYDKQAVPSEKNLRKFLLNYAENLYKSYMEVLELL